jgi:hypothetical protein
MNAVSKIEPRSEVPAMTSPYPPKIAAALHAVMSQCGYVQKKGRNEFHKYSYASEGNLLETLRPAMVEAGLLLIPSVTDVIGPDEHGNTHVTVEYTLIHKDGDVWPEKIVAKGCGNDKNSKGIGDKGTYKAITGANKYLLFKLFQIETGDDPENEESEPTPPKGKAKAPPATTPDTKPERKNATFWRGRSYEIMPQGKPGKYDWPLWDRYMQAAIAATETIEEVAKLDRDNTKWFSARKLDNEEKWQDLRDRLKARHDALDDPFGLPPLEDR